MKSPDRSPPGMFPTAVILVSLTTLILHILGQQLLIRALWGWHFYAFFPPWVFWSATAGAGVAWFWVIRNRDLRPEPILPRYRFMIPLGVLGAVVLFWVLARNWDLLAPAGIVFTVAGLFLFIQSKPRASEMRSTLQIALLISVFHTVPWVLTNASFDRGLNRFSALPLSLGRVESTLAT